MYNEEYIRSLPHRTENGCYILKDRYQMPYYELLIDDIGHCLYCGSDRKPWHGQLAGGWVWDQYECGVCMAYKVTVNGDAYMILGITPESAGCRITRMEDDTI